MNLRVISRLNQLLISFIVVYIVTGACSTSVSTTVTLDPIESNNQPDVKEEFSETITPVIKITPSDQPKTPTSIILTNEPEKKPEIQPVKTIENNKDYIFYTKINSETGHTEVWALDPDTGVKTLIFIGRDIWPFGWSPSGKYWLLNTENGLYVSQSDGSNLQQVLNTENYEYVTGSWLSETSILVNVFPNINQAPEIILIDLQRGTSTKLNFDRPYAVVATSPSTGEWIVSPWNAGALEIIDNSLQGEPILKEFFISRSGFGFSDIQFTPTSNSLLFIGNRYLEDEHLWISAEDFGEPQSLFTGIEHGSFDYFQVSQDGRFVGLVYKVADANKDTITIYIIDLASKQVVYQYVYEYSITSLMFDWSPDSSSIVLPYEEGEPGFINSDAGINVLELDSGTITPVITTTIRSIAGWHFVP